MAFLFGKRRPLGICFFADGGEGGDGSTINGYYAGGGAAAGGDGGDGAKGNEGGSNFDFNEFKNTYAKDFLNKPYMKDIDSPEKLFKRLDGAESLIGKKLGVPGEGATDQEWDDYFNLIRPKDIEVYKFDDSELPEDLKALRPEGFVTKVKNLFKDAALTPKQAAILQKGYDKLLLETYGEILKSIQEQQAAAAKADADFDALADKTWGKDRERVQSVAKSLLQEFTPPEFKDHVNSLSNENLIVLASVLKGVSDKYISQDDLRGMGSGSGSGDVSTLRAEAQTLMAKLSSMSPFDPQYESTKQQVNDLYIQIGKLMGDR